MIADCDKIGVERVGAVLPAQHADDIFCVVQPGLRNDGRSSVAQPEQRGRQHCRRSDQAQRGLERAIVGHERETGPHSLINRHFGKPRKQCFGPFEYIGARGGQSRRQTVLIGQIVEKPVEQQMDRAFEADLPRNRIKRVTADHKLAAGPVDI